ncbi:MAG: DNA topoisomerase I, partial [Caldisphaera sp.]|nr:DNA topoisomerase I [Caldisphaera sp.]
MSRYNKSDCNVNKRFVAIIAEKPKAAEKIADALGSLGRYNKCNYYRVPYWVVYKNGETILVLPSAGHLFGPSTRGKGVPITKIIWRPTWEFDKSAYYTKPYYQLMSNILPKADMYVNACDYDIEGSVIGYKIIENFGDLNKGMRMKYSTLTKPDIINAFNKLTNIDMDNVNAGSARHELDWLWGINVSRLLMKLFKISAGKSISLSAGRVQSPTLAEAIKRWEEINLYLPIPIFNINIVGEFNEKKFQITTKDWYPENISQAKDVVNYLNNNPILTVSSYQEFKEKIDPPPAFNLGDLQKEASRIYGFSPFKTQGIAEELYLDALISYPRTNSQKLPKTINYKEIIYGLGKQNYYKDLTNSILNETKGYLSPKQGKEEDPAHPAIYPTGEIPKKKLYGDQFKIYDLIVRRFLAAFGKQAVVNRSYAELLDGLKRKYKADGLIILDEGWFKYYTFSYPKANEIPVLKNGDKVYVVNVSLKTIWPKTNTTLSKYSLLRWMEKVNIGTKATRARIIEMLYRRKYLS